MGIAASHAASTAMQATCASAESLVIGPERKPGEAMVVFYRLGRKFVDESSPAPDEGASDIIYYTLAVGHHTGVIDCFDESMSCPLQVYADACGLIEDDAARYKLQGVLRSGEIQVGQGDVATLDEPVKQALAQLKGVGKPNMAMVQLADWLEGLSGLLDAMKEDSALYLMGRERR